MNEQQVEPPQNVENSPSRVPLPKEYQQTLDRLRPDIPEAWKDKAINAARFLYLLDSTPTYRVDEDELTNRAKFVRQLSQMGFFQNAIYRVKNGEAGWEKSLPRWLVNAYAPTRLGGVGYREKVDEVEEFYEKELVPRGTMRADRWGNYLNFQDIANPQIGNPITDTYLHAKVYIEGVLHDRGLSDIARLREAFLQMKDTQVHPYSMKMHEDDMMVLYFNGFTSERARRLEDIFRKLKLPIRGPAQDPVSVTYNKDGVPQAAFRTSNDNSLNSLKYLTEEEKADPRRWKGLDINEWCDTVYSPERFLDKYLRLLWHPGKNPEASFGHGVIHVIDEAKRIAPQVAEAGRELQLPVYASTSDPMTPFSE